MTSPSDQDRIARALDGRLDAAELDALRADIVRDPALRAAYTERAWLDSLLRAEREHLPQVLASAATPATRSAAPWIGVAWAATAAAVLALILTLSGNRTPAPAPAIAVLTQAADTRWASSTLPTAEGSALGRGTLALVEGIATLRFASGATLNLEAPTTLELIDALHTRLIEGSVTADVPPSAHGFTVETSDLRVVDLGTRFGVTAGSTGNSHVFVFDGEVRLDSPTGVKLRELTAGKSFHIGSGAVVPGTAEPMREPTPARIDGWTSISTAYGRGRDGFVRRGTETPLPNALLMVKHSDLPRSHTNERRAFLTFDLSALDRTQLHEAELILDPEPSGFGFSTLVLDARFALYGVVDEARDTWSEAQLTWSNAPVTGDSLDTAPLVRLAQFDLPRGASGEPLTIRSPALRDFLLADTNGLATFILVRETGEIDPSGLVHAFAAKEHPTARPPTLRVR